MPAPAPDRGGELPVVFRRDVPLSLADLRAIQKQIETLVPRISPAVVAVELDSASGDGNVASGSGVVISADGMVLTAGHVCESPNREVRFEFPDGKVAMGKTLGLDEDADTGLMKIDGAGPWPFAPLAICGKRLWENGCWPWGIRAGSTRKGRSSCASAAW